jgi:3-oxoacyl-[acyl-carrier protein] reductase
MEGNVREKWALITGAGRGIGAAIARRLAEEGIHLILHYFRSEQEVRRVERECKSYGVQVCVIQANLTMEKGAEILMESCPVSPDILVLNAGLSHYGLIQDITPAQWEEIMNIHVRTPFFLAQKALPKMIQRKWGRIITISSIWGVTGASFEVLYSTAKGALAKEVAPSGITVNSVAPGLIETDMILSDFSPEDLAEITADIPASRIGKPEEVAALVSFLSREEAGYINGQVIHINGAWYA